MVGTASMYNKLKTNLRLCIQRLKLLAKKKTELTQKARPEIASYLHSDKVDRAKIRVEHIIREDYLVEAYEILEMYCDLLLTRFSLIEQMKTLDEGLVEPISSLIWSAPRIEGCTELKVVAEILVKKYGKVFAQAARENSLNKVNEKLIQKLSIEAPPKILVERYLVEIAKSQDIAYEPDPNVMNKGPGGPGGGSGAGGGSTDRPLIGFLDFPEITNPPMIPAQAGHEKIGFRGDLFDVGVDPLAQPSTAGLIQPASNFPFPQPNFPVHPTPPSHAKDVPQAPSFEPPRPTTPPPSYPADLDFGNLPQVPTTLPHVPDDSPNNDDKKNGDDDEIDFDALTKRFEALKKIK
ncbi:increased sodium tolerance 1-like protein [Brevipalpus obovatus]|uniref:increased sodium tolerance 1-like protein n=1 Tax=Brevipalpus obovatus TaxID=246614 RepID=UPI003D9FA2A8